MNKLAAIASLALVLTIALPLVNAVNVPPLTSPDMFKFTPK